MQLWELAVKTVGIKILGSSENCTKDASAFLNLGTNASHGLFLDCWLCGQPQGLCAPDLSAQIRNSHFAHRGIAALAGETSRQNVTGKTICAHPLYYCTCYTKML